MRREEQAEERMDVKDGSGGGKVASARRALACVVWVYIVVTGIVVVV